jgi:hypothetical protein
MAQRIFAIPPVQIDNCNCCCMVPAGQPCSKCSFSDYTWPGWTITTTLLGMQNPVAAIAGTGYAINDILTVAGGTYNSPAKFKVTAIGGGTEVTAIALVQTGDYEKAPTNVSPISTTSSDSGTGCILAVTYSQSLDSNRFTIFSIATVAVAFGGTDYTSGAILTAVGGSGSQTAQFKITGESGGVVTAVQILNLAGVLQVGHYLLPPTFSIIVDTTTNGNGTGCRIAVDLNHISTTENFLWTADCTWTSPGGLVISGGPGNWTLTGKLGGTTQYTGTDGRPTLGNVFVFVGDVTDNTQKNHRITIEATPLCNPPAFGTCILAVFNIPNLAAQVCIGSFPCVAENGAPAQWDPALFHGDGGWTNKINGQLFSLSGNEFQIDRHGNLFIVALSGPVSPTQLVYNVPPGPMIHWKDIGFNAKWQTIFRNGNACTSGVVGQQSGTIIAASPPISDADLMPPKSGTFHNCHFLQPSNQNCACECHSFDVHGFQLDSWSLELAIGKKVMISCPTYPLLDGLVIPLDAFSGASAIGTAYWCCVYPPDPILGPNSNPYYLRSATEYNLEPPQDGLFFLAHCPAPPLSPGRFGTLAARLLCDLPTLVEFSTPKLFIQLALRTSCPLNATVPCSSAWPGCIPGLLVNGDSGSFHMTLLSCDPLMLVGGGNLLVNFATGGLAASIPVTITVL